MTRSMLSAGAEDADILFEDELRLAIKSMLGIPWILNRWLKQAGVGQHIWGYEKNCKNASPEGSHGEVHGCQHTKQAVA
ncbi:hypothetical protein EMCRGX_G033237 [Ephydatia muelleri]